MKVYLFDYDVTEEKFKKWARKNKIKYSNYGFNVIFENEQDFILFTLKFEEVGLYESITRTLNAMRNLRKS